MSEDIFRELQQRLDTYSLGFPATKSGIEIEILKELFSDEDVALFMDLTPMLETPESIASRIDKPIDDVATHLEDMAARGLLFRRSKADACSYGAIPFVHGLFEFQVKRLSPKFARMMEKYLDEEFRDSMIKGADTFLRTIPVQHSLDDKVEIASYDDICEILRSRDPIVLTDCACRKGREVVDEVCDAPMEACFMFGSMGQYYLDHDMGRKIDADEAIRIVTECQKAGLVTQPASSQNPGGMCNCCGDCCGVLRSLKHHPKPAEMVFSNHFAELNAEECTGCEACVDICQMDAAVMTDDGIAKIDIDRCIGCGLCVTACPAEAVKLTLKAESELRVPAANTFEQMMRMAEKRGITF